MCQATFGHIPIPKLAKFRAPTGMLLTIGKVQASDDCPILLPKSTVDVVQITKSSMCSSRLLLFFEKHKVFLHVFHHFPSFSQQFTTFPSHGIPMGSPGPHRFVPGRQRHHGAPARAPGAAPGRRGAGLPAAGSSADAGEAAAGRVGRLDLGKTLGLVGKRHEKGGNAGDFLF